MNHEARTVTATYELQRVTVGSCNVYPDMNLTLFRAPVVLESSGSFKSYPHVVEWKHLQRGDLVIAIAVHNENTMHNCQLWHVLAADTENCEFEVEVLNICGLGNFGGNIYERMANLMGVDPDGHGILQDGD